MELNPASAFASMVMTDRTRKKISHDESPMKSKPPANRLITRRQFSQTALMAGGAGLSLGQLLRLQAANY